MLYAAIDIHKHVFQAAVFDRGVWRGGRGAVLGGSRECSVGGRSGGAAGSRRWRSRRRRGGVGRGASLQHAGSRSGWRSPFRRAVCSAGGGARRPTGSTRAGWRGCWRARCCRSRGSRPRRSSDCVTGRACGRRWRRIARRWAQRLHACLLHEGWPCSRSRLLSVEGLRWAAGLRLPDHARLHVDSLLRR